MEAIQIFNGKCGNGTGKKRKMFLSHKGPVMYLDKNDGKLTEFT
jgi:hypothetical protein